MQRGAKHKTAKELYKEIRRYLIQAADDKFLEGGQARVHEILKFDQRRDGKCFITVGNVRNFKRDPGLPHFRRTKDHAWFDFLLVLAERASRVEILLYDFELRLPSKGGASSYVRFDLNPPDHDMKQTACARTCTSTPTTTACRCPLRS